MNTCKEWSLLIGRFQCIPPHEGHIRLIRAILDEGKNVVIGFRAADGTEKNPYTFVERKNAFMQAFLEEYKAGRLFMLHLPDVTEVVHGRRVGWSVREIKLPDEIEAISGTQMREEGKG